MPEVVKQFFSKRLPPRLIQILKLCFAVCSCIFKGMCRHESDCNCNSTQTLRSDNMHEDCDYCIHTCNWRMAFCQWVFFSRCTAIYLIWSRANNCYMLYMHSQECLIFLMFITFQLSRIVRFLLQNVLIIFSVSHIFTCAM